MKYLTKSKMAEYIATTVADEKKLEYSSEQRLKESEIEKIIACARQKTELAAKYLNNRIDFSNLEGGIIVAIVFNNKKLTICFSNGTYIILKQAKIIEVEKIFGTPMLIALELYRVNDKKFELHLLLNDGEYKYLTVSCSKLLLKNFVTKS